MRFKKILVFYLFVLLLVAQGCGMNTNTYSGKKIKLEFAGVRDIPHEAWIKVDGVKYTHYNEYDLQSQDSYSLQASKSRYTVRGETRLEPNNPFTIALNLSNNLSFNSKKEDYRLAMVVPDQVYLLHIAGTLILSRADSSEFTIEIPKEYPVKISVID